MIARLLLAGALALLGLTDTAIAKCNARFLNPLTEVCYDCIFPISIGGASLFGSRPDTPNPGSPLCACGGFPPRIGLSIGLWEPVRLTDIADEPGCLVNLGLKLDLGLFATGKGAVTVDDVGSQGSRWQAHYYYYPLLSWLGTLIDGLCLEASTFDVAYMSEFDPLWQDPELQTLINPEAVLFANPVAQGACAADCVAASSGGLGQDKLFWCNGCQGALYPMTGDANEHYGAVQASETVAAKLLARMHRFGLARRTSGSGALCQPQPAPLIPKSQYRFQITRPKPMTSGRYACAPIGASTQFMDAGRAYPFKGESFGWLTWRKHNCCAL